MRRTLTAAAAATGLALALTACGGSSGNSNSSSSGSGTSPTSGSTKSSSSTLTVWADNSANTAKAIEPLCLAWAKANGVTCVVKKFNGGGPVDDALTKGNGTGAVPDIFEAAHNGIGGYVDNGIIAPVDLSANKSQFNPKAIQAVTYNGNTYGVPWAVENVGLFVNTKLVSGCPSSLDDAVSNAKKLISEGKVKKGLGIALQIGSTGDAYHWYPLYSADGGYSFGDNSDGTTNVKDLGITKAGSIKAGERLQQLVSEGMLSGSVTYDIAGQAFESGKAAYWITGPWSTPAIESSSVGKNFKLCSVPSWAGSSSTSTPFLGIRAFFQTAKAPNPTLASTFISYLQSTSFMDGMYKIDPRPSAWLPSLAKETSNPIVKAFTDYGKDGVPMPNVPQMTNWFTNMGLAEYKIATGTTPKTALDAASAATIKQDASLG